MAEAVGSVNWWGFSPALDLQAHLPEAEGELNVLLVGCGDARHALKTLALARR